MRSSWPGTGGRPALFASLGALSVTVACSSSPSPLERSAQVDVGATLPAAAPVAPTAVAPNRPGPCAQLRALQARSLAAAIDAARRAGAGKDPADDAYSEKEALERLARETEPCRESGRGAWALVVERLSPMPWDGWNGLRVLLSLAYADHDGVRARVTPFDTTVDGGFSPKEDNFYFSNVDGASVSNFTAFDYDGDGEREIVVTFAGKYHEGESWAWGRVYTATSQGIAPYAQAAGIPFSSIVDEDADGRPDLLGGEPYDDVFENCCSGFSSLLEGPPLLAHALADGSFSRTDAVAVAVAKRACPSPPREIVAGGAAWDVGAVHTAVACSRLWGVDPAKILAAIDKAFGKSKKPRSTPKSEPSLPAGCDVSNCASIEETRAHALSWLAATPPLTLR